MHGSRLIGNLLSVLYEHPSPHKWISADSTDNMPLLGDNEGSGIVLTACKLVALYPTFEAIRPDPVH